jgi:hypothetical protein
LEHAFSRVSFFSRSNLNEAYHYKLLLAKEYHRQGQLIDGYALNFSGSSTFLIRYGVAALKERLAVSRDIISQHFNESALSTVLFDYYFDPKYLYISVDTGIEVYDPKTHKKVRFIKVDDLEEFLIIDDLLYIHTKGPILQIYTISLSTVIPVMTKLTGEDLEKYLYPENVEEDVDNVIIGRTQKHILSYKGRTLIATNIKTRKVIRVKTRGKVLINSSETSGPGNVLKGRLWLVLSNNSPVTHRSMFYGDDEWSMIDHQPMTRSLVSYNVREREHMLIEYPETYRSEDLHLVVDHDNSK